MIKLGLVGEAPHDTTAFSNLFGRHYGDSFQFFSLINGVRGDFLENRKVNKILRKEYEIQKPDLVIFIRDLDGLEDDKTAITKRKEYLRDFRRTVDRKALMLLNIYAMEALILADIATFNAKYACSVPVEQDPMTIPSPEKHLKRHSKYSEGQLAEVFKHLDFDTLLQNCRYFAEFVGKLEKELGLNH